MEADVRAVLTEAVQEPEDAEDLATALLDRVGAVGGTELETPARSVPVRRADFDAAWWRPVSKAANPASRDGSSAHPA
ncbi:hypothetical protein [Actinomadura atramentaria]|uniref:hypothetical protein n=1 Tax=Actinomadura atramentaria TaxID=1990 RepID=UPI000377B86F|nr:hypothetical protein [Actinomadura atramentaria]